MPASINTTDGNISNICASISKMHVDPVADPGFSRGGCANSHIWIILQIFCRELHENERIWTPSGARVPGAP